MRYIWFTVLLIVVTLIFGITLVYAIYGSSASNNGNTFTAAAVFPTSQISPTITVTISPTAIVTPTIPVTPTGTQIANHIVISEVQIALPGVTTSDFIELYNPTNTSINLGTIKLVKRTTSNSSDTSIISFGSSDIIPAHGFYLWASSVNGYATSASVSANVSSTDTISSNDSIAIKLKSNDSIVDAVAWGTGHTAPLIEGSAFTTNPPSGKSIERKANSLSTLASMIGADASQGNGFDSDNNFSDFILRTTPQPQNSSSTPEP